MKAHPIAELFPMMDADQLKELAADIKENGLQEPIITLEDKILDGRNRFDACQMAGVKIDKDWIVPYDGNDPISYVVSHNFKRRHLSVAVRSEIAAKIVTMRQGARTDIAPNGAKLSQADAAKVAGVSRRSVQRAAAKLSGDKPKPSKKKVKTSGWTADELKKDDTLWKAFEAIVKVYGKDDTKAIRKGAVGLSKPDVLFLSKLPAEKMRSIQDLVMANRWTPKKALAFIEQKPTPKSTIDDEINWCLGTKNKKWSAVVGGFTLTCASNKK